MPCAIRRGMHLVGVLELSFKFSVLNVYIKSLEMGLEMANLKVLHQFHDLLNY